MPSNQVLSSAIVVAGGLFASAALATTGESGMHKGQDVTFEKLDENGDGYISRTEFESTGVEQVDHSTLDFDNDGRVDRTEFAAFERMHEESPEQGAEYPEQGNEYPEQGTERYESRRADDPRSRESDD